MADFGSLYNVNVGVLGHVDSGKTALVAALSTTLSTAALDKHPQSRERGITLDLGFSSFAIPAPPEFVEQGFDGLQCTLVDCPGHASLIRTVVGGAQIMDAALLVVDVTKGIQTQTAECIVIGEITTETMIVALNKIDLLDPDKQERHLKKARKLVAATLAGTRFAGCPVVPVSARAPGEGVDALREALLAAARPRPPATSDAPFLMYVDHCFAIKGQGTVLTGTVARGRLAVGDAVELPALKQTRKVKSIQVFRRPVQSCTQGDRVGVCVTQLEAGAVERGVAAAPGTVPSFAAAVVAAEKVRFYPGEVRSGAKMHVIVGHQTVMAKLTFFGNPRSDAANGGGAAAAATAQLSALSLAERAASFDFSAEYLYQEELYGAEGRPAAAEGGAAAKAAETTEPALPPHHGPQWALIQFDEPVTAPADCLVIGARLDADLNASACRIALSGRVAAPLAAGTPTELSQLRIYKMKEREGAVERIEADGCTAVCRGMFSKDSDLSRFLGMAVEGPAGERGILEGSFGKSGKFKVRFPGGVAAGAAGKGGAPAPVVLQYKRYIFDSDKRRIAQ